MQQSRHYITTGMSTRSLDGLYKKSGNTGHLYQEFLLNILSSSQLARQLDL